MRIGSSRATRVTKSNSVAPSSPSRTSTARARTASSYSAIDRGAKGRLTRRRSRVCSGASISIRVRRASVSSASMSSRRIP